MADSLFPILGTGIPPMLGRAAILQRIWNDLTKRSPSHLSVVGPRFAGKTVLMHSLAMQMRQKDTPYTAVVFWDLGHQTPDGNQAFIKALCRKLGEGLKDSRNDYGDHLLEVKSNEYAELRDILDVLYDDGKKILMLWDGFDKPLSTGKLTRNLWDQLRELASLPSLRLVTATRRPLHELLVSEESVTSDFWNIFDINPIKVGVFDEKDCDEVLETINGLNLDKGARTELENWASNYPPLYLALLNRIIKSGTKGKVDSQMVNKVAESAIDEVSSMVHYLWDDCPEPAKNLYLYLLENEEAPLSNIGKTERYCLEEKGFVKVSGSRITKSCRFLDHFITSQGQNHSSMFRLFGHWDAYKKNIRSLLELRLYQINFSDRLFRYVESAVMRLPNDPELIMNDLTSIEERALNIIWYYEFGADRNIPQEIINYWTEQSRIKNKTVKTMVDENSFVVPPDRGRQIGVLQLLTGSTQYFESKSKFISKDTYVLLNSIHSYRNRNQHKDSQDENLGLAIAAIMSCIELVSCLANDLAPVLSP